MALKDFRTVFLPYCLKKQSDGRYAVLNREYKPVGFFTKNWIEYATLPVLVKFKGLTSVVAAKVSHKGDPDVETIYLYDDYCAPVRSGRHMDAYLSRLETLAGLKVDGQPEGASPYAAVTAR